jgi:hypothetical protein
MLGISNTFDLDPSSNDLSFSNCEKSFIPSGEEVKISKEEWKKLKYYKEKEYLKHYTPELLGYVNSNLDINLMKQFNYDIELKPKD